MASQGESDPLVHHLNTADWHEQAHRHKESAHKRPDHLPGLDLSDHEKYTHTLTNSKLAPSQRLEAARHLIDDGVHNIDFKDEQGTRHDYHIRLSNGGRVSVAEGDHIVVQDGGQQSVSPASTRNRPDQAAGDRTHAKPQLSAQRPEAAHEPQYSHAGKPVGLSETGGGHYRYDDPSGGQSISTPERVAQPHFSGVKNADGSVRIGFTGCAVDTDGRGASRHAEDGHRRSVTSLTRSDGRYLDTDKDNFVVLSPSVAAAYGINIGDLGWLVRKDTGAAVPVVFGDTGHEGRKSAEASVAALKALGYKDVDGNNGVTGGGFEIVLAPGSGNGRGDIARDTKAMTDKLYQSGLVASLR